jgi:peroxiredoxin
MKRISLLLLLICLLSEQQVNAQDETQVAANLEQRQNELSVIWHPSINNLKERAANGDKNLGDSIDAIVDLYRAANVEMYRNFILEFPNTETAAGLIYWFYFDAPFDTLLSVYDKLGPVAKQSKGGVHAAGFIERGKKLLPGKEAPLFSHPDTSGVMVHLKDYRGKYVLLEFWAHWCVPCRAENPNLKNAYSKYNTKGFEILGISMDKEKEKQEWKGAIIKDGLPWQQVSDLKGYGNEVFALYNVMPIPDNYLIDPEGKILARGIRGEALQEKLASIFNKY